MEKNKKQFDEIDMKLLNLLQDNSRITIKNLSEKLFLSTTPIYERIKKLEKAGLIKQYITLLDPNKIDRKLVVFISINLTSHTKQVVEGFEKEVEKLDEVSECYYVSGNFDFLLKVYCKDMEAYHDFLTDKLSVIDNISQFYSSFVLTNSKLSYKFNL